MDNNFSENQSGKMQNRSDGAQARQYTLVGLLFGLLFPVIATLIRIWQSHLSFSLPTVIETQRSDILLWIIDTAPIILGLLAGFAGTRQDSLIETNQRLLKREEELKLIHVNLEQHVEERTNQLSQRSELLRSSAFIVRNAAELQDVPTLLERTVHLASDLFNFYHVAIYFLDEERRIAFLQAASSGAGKKMMESGFQIESDSKNVIGYVSEQKKSYIITEAGDGDQSHLISEGKLDDSRSEMVIPLIVRGKITGIMDFQSRESRIFKQDEIEILQLLADQIAISIDNVNLINSTQAFVHELESLATQQTKDVWKRYLENRGIAYQYTPSGTKLINPNQRMTKTQKAMQVPLRLRGQEIGILTFQGKETARWAERERDVAEKVATQVALALDNSRLLEETRQRAIQQQTVNEISTRLNRSLDIDTVLQTAARELGALPEVVEVSVFVGEVKEHDHDPKLNRST